MELKTSPVHLSTFMIFNVTPLVSRVVLVPILSTGASCHITSSFSIAGNGAGLFFKNFVWFI